MRFPAAPADTSSFWCGMTHGEEEGHVIPGRMMFFSVAGHFWCFLGACSVGAVSHEQQNKVRLHSAMLAGWDTPLIPRERGVTGTCALIDTSDKGLPNLGSRCSVLQDTHEGFPHALSCHGSEAGSRLETAFSENISITKDLVIVGLNDRGREIRETSLHQKTPSWQ